MIGEEKNGKRKRETMTEAIFLPTGQAAILTINGGSSSIKFALYLIGEPLQLIMDGRMERIGLPGTTLTIRDIKANQQDAYPITGSSHQPAAMVMLNWLESKMKFSMIKGVGHRVVHGMNYAEPQRVTPLLLSELHRICPYDLEHLPMEIQMMELLAQRYPQLPQVACFDTAFHRQMPQVAKILPIPRRFTDAGVQRYGFHGLSYDYLITELQRIAGDEAAQGRVILAHLGNGASLAAVQHGKSMDTSMGFTPAGGIPMGSRPGDLDPGVVWAMMEKENLTAAQLNQLLNHQSGLLGISDTSPDMRDLLALRDKDLRAAEAVDHFCYQIKKWIGGFAAALGGVETLVFSGGIGEHAPEIRAQICRGLEFLGINLAAGENAADAAVISTAGSRVTVRVMHTDETWLIANTVRRMTR